MKQLDYVIHLRDTWSQGYTEAWVDNKTQRYRGDNYDMNPPASTGVHRFPSPTVTSVPLHLSTSTLSVGPADSRQELYVDYVQHVWSQSTESFDEFARYIPNAFGRENMRYFFKQKQPFPGITDLPGPRIEA